ncbi:MAG TPA: rhodanese-like domain-containing protein [Actinomycetota bacterium]|nr:rhodanese-like domain-containing protein [Actinomycetota bacterium]
MPRTVDDLLAEARARYERIHAVLAAAERDVGALIVDLRPSELRRAHGEVPGAIPIGLNVLEWRLDPASPWRIPEIDDHDRRVILVCQEGYSSSLAVARLLDLGITRATDVIDGVDGWRSAGLPLEPFDPARGPRDREEA